MIQRKLTGYVKLCGLLGIVILTAAQYAFAEGKCTGGQMEKMIQAGFTKEEILKLCSGADEGQAPETPIADEPAPVPQGEGGQINEVPQGEGEQTNTDLNAMVVGSWRCQTNGEPNLVTELNFSPDGTFNQYDTYTSYEGTNSSHVWGTYAVQSRGGNRFSITSTVRGSSQNVSESIPPGHSETTLFTMVDKNTAESETGVCKRTQ